MSEVIEAGGVQNLDELDSLIEKSKTQKEQKATYFILSSLMPPFTIYLVLFLSNRKKLLYKTLPALLIFYSAITVVFNLLGLIAVKPPSQATQLGITFDAKLNARVSALTIITTILALICLAIGFYFKNKAKKNLSLEPSALWILFLFLNLLVYGVIFLMFEEMALLFGSIAPAINTGYEGL